jgi:hypothetical protein
MNQTQMFSKVAGVVQGLFGLAGQFAPGMDTSVAAGTGGNIFNILSGGVLSYLGFRGTPQAQRTGAQGLGIVNLVVGVLGALGVSNIVGIPLNQTTIATIVNFLVGIWGTYAGFFVKPKAAAA